MLKDHAYSARDRDREPGCLPLISDSIAPGDLHMEPHRHHSDSEDTLTSCKTLNPRTPRTLTYDFHPQRNNNYADIHVNSSDNTGNSNSKNARMI